MHADSAVQIDPAAEFAREIEAHYSQKNREQSVCQGSGSVFTFFLCKLGWEISYAVAIKL